MDFVAIDFETANADRSSACAIGIVVAENGTITEHFQKLIKPSDPYFDPFNVSIHGITEEDVEDEPEFDQLWPFMKSYFENKMIIAHYASFDMSVLRYVLDEYEIPYPEVPFSCTRTISKKMWPSLISHSLDIVADHLGIQFTHHKPEEDALACSRIAIEACQQVGVGSLAELAEKLEFPNGKLFPGGYEPVRLHLPQYYAIRPSEIVPSKNDFDPEHVFYARKVVFTGALQSMSRKEAMQRVVDVGGECSNSINRSVNILVTGEQDFRRLKDGARSNKMKKVEKLISEGFEIEVISEEEFLKMLHG